MQYTYKVSFLKEPEGGFTVSVPLLPGCITYGETMDEAVEMAKDAITLYIESLIAHGEPVPTEEQVLLTIPDYSVPPIPEQSVIRNQTYKVI